MIREDFAGAQSDLILCYTQFILLVLFIYSMIRPFIFSLIFRARYSVDAQTSLRLNLAHNVSFINFLIMQLI